MREFDTALKDEALHDDIPAALDKATPALEDLSKSVAQVIEKREAEKKKTD